MLTFPLLYILYHRLGNLSRPFLIFFWFNQLLGYGGEGENWTHVGLFNRQLLKPLSDLSVSVIILYHTLGCLSTLSDIFFWFNFLSEWTISSLTTETDFLFRSVDTLGQRLNRPFLSLTIYIIPHQHRFVYWQNAQCSSTILLCFCANRRRPGSVSID